ncbi:hypothetical protein IU469_14390 [Nocardia puris]|uniref:Small secreted domain DUF320 n=1 Tax=Nocardia puris TaxID=208602 RepID=A0A366CXF5_9NOCA|nr:hypothetical protein [Nocardia puris]MBF6211877.1 hypothetical protein [Nocardia puris]MBF6366904.1 hypothetical protein [Nocardia puris]RBO82521.1 hypothetical protein DFR74_12262 [Nocardia puris]
MKRSAVLAALVGAALVGGSGGTATAAVAPTPIDLPAGTGAGTGSAGITSGSAFDTGSSGGTTTTGSGDSGSGAALEQLIFGGPLVCAAVGSAMNRNLTCDGTPGPNIP